MAEVSKKQPTIAELVATHLRHSWTSSSVSEVEPYQASVLPRWSAEELWPGALAAGIALGGPQRFQAAVCPAAWREWVEKRPVRRVVPWCLGLSPRLLCDLQPFLEQGRRALCEPEVGPNLVGWQATSSPILDAALARLAGDYPTAADLLNQASTDDALDLLIINEQAALALAQADYQRAAHLWSQSALLSTPVGQFNLGLVKLITGQPAAEHFSKAAETSLDAEWRHLAELYRWLSNLE